MRPVPVVLLQPPGTCREFTRSGSSYPPLGLCQLAAVVDPSLAEVVDADGMRWSPAQTIDEVLARSPRLVGMTVTSFTVDLVSRYATELRARGVGIVLGGPHASLAPLDLLQRCPAADHLVRGEGEVIFEELCQRAADARPLAPLPGLWTRGVALREGTHEVLRVDRMEGLAFPRFDGLPIGSYWCPDARPLRMLTMMTTRGCPHACGFCSSPTLLGRKIRGWPPEAILDELARLRDVHAVREISFVDDVFTIQPRRTLALCHGMVEKKLGLSWFCNARADQITEELAGAMADAGCHQVYLGFESGSQSILDAVKKRATVADLEGGAAILKAAGIHRSVGFVVGLPGESDATVDASIALAHRVQPERVQFTRFTPLPGSPLAGSGSGTLGTFHSRERDRVGEWIDRMYAACRGMPWGRETW